MDEKTMGLPEKQPGKASDLLPSDQLFQARLRANDYVVSYLKQLVVLSSGTLVLTITFLKDVLGQHAGSAVFTWLVPIAWGLLAICVFFCVWGLGRITYNLDVPDMEPGRSGLPKAFLAGSKTMVPPADTAIWSFATAMGLLAIFAVVNYSLFFQDKNTSAVATALRAEEAAIKVEAAAGEVRRAVDVMTSILSQKDQDTQRVSQTKGAPR